MKSLNTSSISDSGFILTEDNQKISYLHLKKGTPEVIIIAHGFYNSKGCISLQRIAECLKETYDVFMFDFRGHGKSTGLFTWTSSEAKDLKAAIRHVKAKYKKIGVIGFSLGGSIAVNLLSKEQIADSFICVSAPAYLDKIDYDFWDLDCKGDLLYTFFNKDGRKGKGVRLGPFWLKKENPVDNICNLRIPVLFLHGEKDWLVKPWHSKELYEHTTCLKKIVYLKNGPHAEFMVRDYEQLFMNEVNSWFADTLRGAQR